MEPRSQRIFGYEMKEAIGRPIDMLWQTEVSDEAFSIRCLSQEDLRQPGGKTVEFQGYRNNKVSFPIEACFSVWDTPDGPHLGTIIRDISDRKREEDRIRYLAEHDTLTGLLNRDALYSKANAYISGSVRGQSEVALIITAVTNFHQINDMFGHACGDEVLCSVARRLSSFVHEGCLIARLDGDEFAILVSGYAAGSGAELIASRVATSLGGVPLLAAHRQHRIVPSVGLAIYPHHCDTADELLGCAHLALDRARTGGGANQVVFNRAIREEVQARLAVEAELRSALAEDQFELFYQPQVDISDTSIIGAEALIRWRHPERDLVLPGDFMPIVNGSVLSDSVAAWVLEAACRQGAAWVRQGHQIRVGVNLCPSVVRSGNLVALVEAILHDTGFPPSLLELEVTEDILLVDSESTLNTFRQVRDLGVRTVFDDFGTGYASLSYLKKFPLNGLKIDRSFVMNLQPGSPDAAIVECTIALAGQLGLSVIAEGIEHESTACLLANMGCKEGQGYFYGKPMPADLFERKFLFGGQKRDILEPSTVAA